MTNADRVAMGREHDWDSRGRLSRRASTAVGAVATMTSTLARTSSAVSAGSRSYRPVWPMHIRLDVLALDEASLAQAPGEMRPCWLSSLAAVAATLMKPTAAQPAVGPVPRAAMPPPRRRAA